LNLEKPYATDYFEMSCIEQDIGRDSRTSLIDKHLPGTEKSQRELQKEGIVYLFNDRQKYRSFPIGANVRIEMVICRTMGRSLAFTPLYLDVGEGRIRSIFYSKSGTKL